MDIPCKITSVDSEIPSILHNSPISCSFQSPSPLPHPHPHPHPPFPTPPSPPSPWSSPCSLKPWSPCARRSAGWSAARDSAAPAADAPPPGLCGRPGPEELGWKQWDSSRGEMGMDQYLLIPFLGGWTSIYQLFWGSLGTRVLTHWTSPNH